MQKLTTLVVVHDSEKILLGMKKRGFGEGLWNGFGGKVHDDESIYEAAQRELYEETGLQSDALQEAGVLQFSFENDPLTITTHVFVVNEYTGAVIETEEMRPEWFLHSDIPYQQMWTDDIHWLPHVLAGKTVQAAFHFDDPTNQAILRQHVSFT